MSALYGDPVCVGCGASIEDQALYPGTGGTFECWERYQTGTCGETEASS